MNFEKISLFVLNPLNEILDEFPFLTSHFFIYLFLMIIH